MSTAAPSLKGHAILRPARLVLFIILIFLTHTLFASSRQIVNVYTWSEEIPDSVIADFEKETGITVNYTSFDSNEIMFAKLRASKNAGYDVIEPSSYYVDRMRRLGMLEKLDKTRLVGFKNLDPFFTNSNYDPNSENSIPFIWGITGVFLNQAYFENHSVNNWSDLLSQKFINQLMVLDDPREAFSMALLMLGYSINDTNPAHIKEAYLKLRSLMPNVRLFNTDAVASILIDEDANAGLAWNGDLYKANLENSKLAFVYPKDGFEIWVDNFAILKSSPHKDNAYRFLEFMLRPDIAAKVSQSINYSTANLAGRKLLPLNVQNNPTLYPPTNVLRHGQFQTDIGDKTFALYEKYWEQLKMGA